MRTCCFWILCVLGLGSLTACQKTPASSTSFAFDRPELLQLVCLQPNGDPSSHGDPNGAPMVLPMRCCSQPSPLANPDAGAGANYTYDCPYDHDNDPTTNFGEIHALVTQSARGTVAAVDFATGLVIDSDRLIPGFTFVDVGGLPTALVAPEKRPLHPEKPAEGPPWVYVASAEEQNVRAVATCRFRAGAFCGPSEALDNAYAQDPTAPQRLSQVPLPAVPHDMILGPDEALWVTLPSIGTIARIELSADWDLPFAVDPKNPEQLISPQYFKLPELAAPAPHNATFDHPGYSATCGFGYSFSSTPITGPLAPQATTEGAPKPTRLRYDALSKLLFVSDQDLAVLHVFSVSESGQLIALGPQPVGAPLRDFVITGEVPVKAPPQLSSDLLKQNQGMIPSLETQPTGRYLYALDDRDGSLMAFGLSATSSGVTLQPLLAPLTDRYSDRLLFGVNGTSLAVMDTRGLSPWTCGEGMKPTKDKSLSDLADQELNAAKKALSTANSELDKAKSALANATSKHENTAAAQAAVDSAQKRADAAQADVNAWNEKQTIINGASQAQLRGVYIAVTSSNGLVSVIDVFDLDVYCRESTTCNDAPDQGLRDTGATSAVAVQRHAERISAALAPVINPTTDALQSIDCGSIGYTHDYTDPNTKKDLVCIPPDPWNQSAQTWLIQAGTTIGVPGLSQPDGLFATAASGVPGFPKLGTDRLVLLGATGFDFCQAGAQEGVGDVLSIFSEPPPWVTGICPKPSVSNPVQLAIEEAYADRLVLRVMGDNARDRATFAEQLKRCYPDFFSYGVAAPGQQICFNAAKTDCLPFELPPSDVTEDGGTGETDGGTGETDAGTGATDAAAQGDAGTGSDAAAGDDAGADSDAGTATGTGTSTSGANPNTIFLVVTTNGTYLHRQIAGSDGRCVVDATKDPRLTSRAKPGVVFKNPYIAFKLQPTESALVQVTTASSFLRDSDFDPGASSPAAQPYSSLFTPYANLLWVVDTASQGVRGFALLPFQRSGQVYR